MKEVAKMLKAIHAQEDRAAALEKAKAVEQKLRGMKLSKAADKVRDSIHETLTFMNFPEEHWMRIRTNNTLERINREIRRLIPKGSDLSKYSVEDIQRVEDWVNNYPRQVLDFATSKELFDKQLLTVA